MIKVTYNYLKIQSFLSVNNTVFVLLMVTSQPPESAKFPHLIKKSLLSSICARKYKRNGCLLICFLNMWDLHKFDSLCAPDPFPPIKAICGLRGNCNVKNKSAQQSSLCLVTGRLFAPAATVRDAKWYREESKQKVDLSKWSSGHSSLIAATENEPVIKLPTVYLISSLIEKQPGKFSARKTVAWMHVSGA